MAQLRSEPIPDTPSALRVSRRHAGRSDTGGGGQYRPTNKETHHAAPCGNQAFARHGRALGVIATRARPRRAHGGGASCRACHARLESMPRVTTKMLDEARCPSTFLISGGNPRNRSLGISAASTPSVPPARRATAGMARPKPGFLGCARAMRLASRQDAMRQIVRAACNLDRRAPRNYARAAVLPLFLDSRRTGNIRAPTATDACWHDQGAEAKVK